MGTLEHAFPESIIICFDDLYATLAPVLTVNGTIHTPLSSRTYSISPAPPSMPDDILASADDYVESTAVPGNPPTHQFPPTDRPNACA